MSVPLHPHFIKTNQRTESAAQLESCNGASLQIKQSSSTCDVRPLRCLQHLLPHSSQAHFNVMKDSGGPGAALWESSFAWFLF